MFKFQAPYPAIQTTSVVPNPLFGDSTNLTNTLDIKRGMDGTTYSYVKTRDLRVRFIWTFRLSRHKALEMRAFFDAYHSEKIKLTDSDGEVYIGNFTTNPFEFEATRRALNSPGLEDAQIQIEFEGIKDG